MTFLLFWHFFKITKKRIFATRRKQLRTNFILTFDDLTNTFIMIMMLNFNAQKNQRAMMDTAC